MSIKRGFLDVITKYSAALEFLIEELGEQTSAMNILESEGEPDLKNVSCDSPERDALILAKAILYEIELCTYAVNDDTSVAAAEYARTAFKLIDSAMNDYAAGAYTRPETIESLKKAKATVEQWAAHKKKLFAKKATAADTVSASDVCSAVDNLLAYAEAQRLLRSLLSRTEDRIMSLGLMDKEVERLEERVRELELIKTDSADTERELIESHINGGIDASRLADMLVENRKKTDLVSLGLSDCNSRIERFTEEKKLNTEILGQLKSGLEDLLFCLDRTNASFIAKSIDVAAAQRIIDGSASKADIMTVVTLTETAASIKKI